MIPLPSAHRSAALLAAALAFAPATRASEAPAPGPGLSPGTLALARWVPVALLGAGTPGSAPKLAPEGSGAGRPAEPPKSYWVPALEVVGYNILQNRFAYYTHSKEVYGVSWDSFWTNLTNPWWWDEDGFDTNGFAHPYMGTIYHTAARSTGLGFWESFGYAFGGSLMWELAGETEPPSVNDQITTPVGGTVLGEVLFRLANRIYDGGGAYPNVWRHIGAFVVSPVTGFNRLLYGNKYRSWDLNDQPWLGSLRLQFAVAGRARAGGATEDVPGGDVGIAAHIMNGTPTGDWSFRRPFDHFEAEVSAFVNNKISREASPLNILVRGLLAGSRFGEGRAAGLWGLHAGYEFISSRAFRAGSSNAGVGVLGQLPLSSDFTFRGRAYGALGFGSGGTTPETVGARDYHFGLQGVAHLEASFWWNERARLGLAGRGFYTSGKATPDPGSFESIAYGAADLSVRVFGPHALSLALTSARRTSEYPGNPRATQRFWETVVAYVLTERTLGMGL